MYDGSIVTRQRIAIRANNIMGNRSNSKTLITWNFFSFKVQGAITLLKGCWFTELNTRHDDSGIFNVKLYYNVKFNCNILCSENIFLIFFFHLLYMIYIKLIKGFTIMLLSGLKKKLCWFAFFISTMTRVKTLLK